MNLMLRFLGMIFIKKLNIPKCIFNGGGEYMRNIKKKSWNDSYITINSSNVNRLWWT